MRVPFQFRWVVSIGFERLLPLFRAPLVEGSGGFVVVGAGGSGVRRRVGSGRGWSCPGDDGCPSKYHNPRSREPALRSVNHHRLQGTVPGPRIYTGPSASGTSHPFALGAHPRPSYGEPSLRFSDGRAFRTAQGVLPSNLLTLRVTLDPIVWPQIWRPGARYAIGWGQNEIEKANDSQIGLLATRYRQGGVSHHFHSRTARLAKVLEHLLSHHHCFRPRPPLKSVSIRH